MNMGRLVVALALAAGVAGADVRVPFEKLDLSRMTSGWGRPQKNRAIDTPRMRIGSNENVYTNGVGTHAPSTLTVTLGGNATRFVAEAGVDWEVSGKDRNCGTVFFKVFLDGKEVASSGRRTYFDPPYHFDVDLTGAYTADFLVLDAGDGKAGDHADWANAAIYFKDGTGPIACNPEKEQLGILTPPVKAAPRINGARVFGVRPGRPILFSVPATGERPMTFSVKGLPPGATFDEKTGRFGGCVRECGVYPMTITAKNARGETSRAFTLKVGATIALTPPLGWNSWNCFSSEVTDAKVRAAADAMVEKGLDQHGWSYINIDDFWTTTMDEKSVDKTLVGKAREADGTIAPNSRFPDMKALVDYIHAKGLKAGIYSSPGPGTCGRCIGSWEHEYQDAETYAKWGFDYLKYDWCTYGVRQQGTGFTSVSLPFMFMGKALREQDRDIVFSICQYGTESVWMWGATIGNGQLWRITKDLHDHWSDILLGARKSAELWRFSAPGAWNDPDMLNVGRVCWSNFKGTRLTPNEQYTHLSLWALGAAPLMIGCDMTQLDDFTLNLLCNDEIIEIDQDELGAAAAEIDDLSGAYRIVAKPMVDGSVAAGLFNCGEVSRMIPFRMSAYGMLGRWKVRDAWRQHDEGEFVGEYRMVVPPHATAVIRLFPGEGAGWKPGIREIRCNSWKRYISEERLKRENLAGYPFADATAPCQSEDCRRKRVQALKGLSK